MARRGVLKPIVVLLAGGLLGFGVSACGAEDDALKWFIFNEPSGGLEIAAERCSEQSGGAYTIEFEYLPADADGQREQLVRRLGAEDSTIDIVGMDVIWTGEFANAGWLREFTGEAREAVTENVFESVVETATFEERLYGAPIWSNTQLLWYRGDLVDEPPETWDEMIDIAEGIGPEEGRIQVQGNRYEGLVVWANQMIASAGTKILAGPTELELDQEATEQALGVMGRLSRSPVRDPAITTSQEDSARLAFESGNSAFMLNYPFVFPSARENAPEIFEVMEAAKYPGIEPGIESAPPLGGINLGVSAFSDDPDAAFAAVECLVQPENQLEIAELGGLPPVREDLYDQPEIDDVYPGFAELIRDSIADATARPSESPAYQDLSLAIQRAVHPTTGIDPDNPTPAFEELRDKLEQAVLREGLL